MSHAFNGSFLNTYWRKIKISPFLIYLVLKFLQRTSWKQKSELKIQNTYLINYVIWIDNFNSNSLNLFSLKMFFKNRDCTFQFWRIEIIIMIINCPWTRYLPECLPWSCQQNLCLMLKLLPNGRFEVRKS